MQWPTGPCELFVDCKACVDFHGLPWAEQCPPKRSHAGVAQFCRAFSQQCSAHKVKAHLDVDGAEDSWGRYLREGNHAVDISAKRALFLHPQPDGEQVEDLE
eukprot:1201974-Pyramimonas_sp.AAC.1